LEDCREKVNNGNAKGSHYCCFYINFRINKNKCHYFTEFRESRHDSIPNVQTVVNHKNKPAL
jgi:hypothetical protein